MPETVVSSTSAARSGSYDSDSSASAGASSSPVSYSPPRIETFNIPHSHEERLEWVRKSYERFFEKVRELDALMGVPELN